MADSNTNIKAGKKGTLTRAAKKRGLGVQEFASRVMANPDNYSPAIVKKASFAKNAVGLNTFTNGGVIKVTGKEKEKSPFIKSSNVDNTYGGTSTQLKFKAGDVIIKDPQTGEARGYSPQEWYDIRHGNLPAGTDIYKMGKPIKAKFNKGGVKSKYAVGGIVSGITNIGNQIGQADASKNINYDSEGRLIDKDAATKTLIRGSFFNPIGTALTSAKEGGSFGEVAATFLGFGAAFSKKRAARAEEKQMAAALKAKEDRARVTRMGEIPMQEQNTETFAMGGLLQGMPNAEIEGGESIQLPNGENMSAEGPSHAQGGIDVNMPDGTRIFSDRLKVPGTKETFSDANKKIANKIKKHQSIYDKGASTKLARNTSKRMLDRLSAEQDQLFETQQMLNGNSTGEGSESKFTRGGYVIPEERQDSENIQIQDWMLDSGQFAKAPTGLKAGAAKGSFLSSGRLASGLNTALAIAPALYNIGQGLTGKAKQFNPDDFANPYESSVMSKMNNRKVDIDPMLEANRSAAATARYNVKNAARTRGELLGAYAPIAAGQARGDIAARMQQQQLQNQYAAEAAQMQAGFGQQRAATKMQVSDINERNAAAKRNMLGTGLGQLSQYAQIREQARNLKGADAMRRETLKEMFPNFDWSKLYNTENK